MRKRSRIIAHVLLSIFVVLQTLGTGIFVTPESAEASALDYGGIGQQYPCTGVDCTYAFGQNVTFDPNNLPELGKHPETGDYLVFTGVNSRRVKFTGKVQFRDSSPQTDIDTETLLVKVWNSNWGTLPSSPAQIATLPNAKRVGTSGSTYQDYMLLDDCTTAQGQDVQLNVPGSDNGLCANTNYIRTYEFEIPQFTNGTVLFVYSGDTIVKFDRSAALTAPDNNTSIEPLSLSFTAGAGDPALTMDDVCAQSDQPFQFQLQNGIPNSRIDLHFAPASGGFSSATLRTNCTGNNALQTNGNGLLNTNITLCQIHDNTSVSAKSLAPGTYQVYATQPNSINSNTVSVDLQTCAPGLSLTKVAKKGDGTTIVSPLSPNEEYTYELTYSNPGAAVATNAVLVDTIDTTYIASITDAGGATVSGDNTLTWQLGDLAAGSTGVKSYRVKLKDKVSDKVAGIYDVPNTATITSGSLSATANELVQVAYVDNPFLTKTAQAYTPAGQTKSSASLVPGDVVRYTIDYGNDGTANVTNALIKDVLNHADLYDVLYISNGGTSSVSGTDRTVVWDPVGDDGDCRPTGKGCGETLAANPQAPCANFTQYGCSVAVGERQVIIKMKSVLPHGATIIDEVATLYYDGGTKQDEVPVTVTAASSCVITKAVDKAEANPGDTIRYTINYANNSSNASCTSVSIEDALDNQNQDHLTLVNGSVSNNGTVSTNAEGKPLVTWTIGNVAPGATGSVTYQAKIDSTFPPSSGTQIVILNDAELISAELPNGILSNQVSTVVGVGPSMNITKAVDKTQAKPADNIVYTLTVRNNGSVQATNVVVDDPFNNENQDLITYVSSVPDPVSGKTDQWNLGTMQPGASVQIKVTAKIDSDVPARDGGTLIHDIAKVDSSETPQQTSNEVTTLINPQPAIDIDKAVDKDTVKPGESFVYTLTYRNTGDATATNTVIRDPFTNKNQDLITFVSANPAPDAGTTDKWTIGALKAGEEKTIAITARVKGTIPEGETRIDDLGLIKTNQTTEKKSNVVTIVAIYTPPVPEPIVKKPVPTTGQGAAVAIGIALALGVIAGVFYVTYHKKDKSA